MSAAASKRGYTLRSKARQITSGDFARFDLIVAMDSDNYADIIAMADTAQLASENIAEVRLLGSFLPGHSAQEPPSVPDPYYGGDAGFETVLDMIEQATPAIIEHCQHLAKQQ